MTLGSKIQELRKRAGLSQEALADALGVSRQAVSKWETNQTYPDTENLLALAALFHVSSDALAGLKQDPLPAPEETQMAFDKRRLRPMLPAVIFAVLIALIVVIIRPSGNMPLSQPSAPDITVGSKSEMQTADTTQTVYIALCALEDGSALSSEEVYRYRQDIYRNLEYLDWQLYGTLGEAGQDTETTLELLQWLAFQETLSENELLGLMAGGCGRTNLDGAFTDSYCIALAKAFIAYPQTYTRTLSNSTFSDEERELLISMTGYGCDVPEALHQEALDAAETLRQWGLAGESWGKSLYERINTPL